MGFDPKSVEEVDTIEIEIEHPKTGQPTGAKVVVASRNSAPVKAVQRKLITKALKSRTSKMTAEMAEASALDIAVASIISWSDIEDNGHPLECTPENARKLLQMDWFFQQINDAASDQQAFIKA